MKIKKKIKKKCIKEHTKPTIYTFQNFEATGTSIDTASKQKRNAFFLLLNTTSMRGLFFIGICYVIGHCWLPFWISNSLQKKSATKLNK